jgi:hypothetical protein
MTTRAADDFAFIRERMAVIAKERAPAEKNDAAPALTEVHNGTCWQCAKHFTPCNGACYGC